MNRRVFLFSAAAIFYFAPGSCASENTAGTELRSLDKDAFEETLNERISSIHDLSFGFTQVTYAAGSTQTVKAEVFFNRPGSIRVNYKLPRKQEIIYTEETLYTYIPAINQATRQRREDITDILGAAPSVIFSTGAFTRLRKEFDITVSGSDELLRFEAVPLVERGYDRLRVELCAESFLPLRSDVKAVSLVSETEFEDYRINTGLDEDIFRFHPPPGTGVIELD